MSLITRSHRTPFAPTKTAADYHRDDLAQLAEIRKWAASSSPRLSVSGNAPKVTSATAPPAAERPTDVDDMVGQTDLLGQLRMVIAGSRLRNRPMPHVLLEGPAGFGKTSLAQAIAAQLGWGLVTTTGMTLRKPAELAGLLMRLEPDVVLFIDEIHALNRAVMEMLYEVLEDGTLSSLVGSGSETMAYTHKLSGFVCVGATTRPGLLTDPFRDRFGFKGTLAQYSDEELATIVGRSWTHQGVTFEESEPLTVAQRCKGVPRRAKHLADRVLDYASCLGDGSVTEGTAGAALDAFGIDAMGLDDTDYAILDALCGHFGGRTVGLDALAQFLNLDQRSLQEEHEPYLTRSGLVLRSKTGRMASPAALAMMRERREA